MFLNDLKPFQMVSASECLTEDREKNCDKFLQEDCKYTGANFLVYGAGEVNGHEACQKGCEADKKYCKYWIFDEITNVCTHKKEDVKDCEFLSGPKSPTYRHCRLLEGLEAWE